MSLTILNQRLTPAKDAANFLKEVAQTDQQSPTPGTPADPLSATPNIQVAVSPEASGSISIEPNGKPGLYHLLFHKDGKTEPAGLIRNLKNQIVIAHITKSGLVVELQCRSIKQRYFIFPGGEYRSQSGLHIKLWPKSETRPGKLSGNDSKAAGKQTITHQALVPVGGQATRLAPISQMVPKPAIPIAPNGQTLIGRVVESLKDHGIQHVMITTRVMPDLIKKALRFIQPGNPQVSYVHEDGAALGDIGSLINMLKDPAKFGLDVSKPLLVVQGDAYTNANYTTLLKAHQKNKSALTFAFKIVQDDMVDQFGIIATDASDKDGYSGNIHHFIEKPKPSDTPYRNANTGIMVLSPEVLKLLPEIHQSIGSPRKVNFAVEIMPELLKRIKAGEVKNSNGEPLTAWAEKMVNMWHDVGRPNNYFEVHEGKDHKGTVFWPGAQEHYSVTVAGNVIALKTP